MRRWLVPEIKKPEIDPGQRDEIKLMFKAFQHKFISEMLLDVALIKDMLDGVKAATFSPIQCGGIKKL